MEVRVCRFKPPIFPANLKKLSWELLKYQHQKICGIIVIIDKQKYIICLLDIYGSHHQES